MKKHIFCKMDISKSQLETDDCADIRSTQRNWDKYILLLGQIHIAIWTNTFGAAVGIQLETDWKSGTSDLPGRGI